LGEVAVNPDALNTALLQQSAARAALRRTCDLSAIDHYISTNGIRETMVDLGADGALVRNRTAVGINELGSNSAFTNSVQRCA
jgi:hypothetical protein